MKLKPNTLHRITFSMAVIGLIVTIAGNFLDISVAKKLCYLVGALVLLLSATLEKNTFFSILEVILSIGALTAFLPLSPLLKSLIPISLGVCAAIYFGVTGRLNDHLTWLSMASVLFGTWGYALTNSCLYFWAGAITAIYSFLSFKRGEKIALVFGVLNIVFALTALMEIYRIF
jgi:hypothetical protein